MVRKSIIGLSLLPILLLASCQKKTLRSDIAEFIASFSLQDSIAEYQEAGYEKITEVVDEEGASKEVEKVDFNVKDDSAISYNYSYKSYVDDVLDKENFITITTEDNKYFYKSESEEKEITKDEVNSIVITFFYKTDDYDYHGKGCYYGDIVNDGAYAFQDYTTIDQVNHLYVLDYELKDTSVDAVIKQNVVVNQLGMLVSNYLKLTGENVSSVSTLNVYKK